MNCFDIRHISNLHQVFINIWLLCSQVCPRPILSQISILTASAKYQIWNIKVKIRSTRLLDEEMKVPSYILTILLSIVTVFVSVLRVFVSFLTIFVFQSTWGIIKANCTSMRVALPCNPMDLLSIHLALYSTFISSSLRFLFSFTIYHFFFVTNIEILFKFYYFSSCQIFKYCFFLYFISIFNTSLSIFHIYFKPSADWKTAIQENVAWKFHKFNESMIL